MNSRGVELRFRNINGMLLAEIVRESLQILPIES